MQTLSILPLILCCCIALGHSLGAEFGHFGLLRGRRNSKPRPHRSCWLVHHRAPLEDAGEICAYGKFRYFGVQNSAGCFCGNSYGRHGKAADSDCNMACAGNSAQICGGSGRNSVYRQVYNRPDSEYFALADRDYVNVTSTAGPFYRTEQPVRSLTECLLARCVTDCQAVLFHLDACHLLRFPVLPHELKNVAGKFATRV
uniref:WSC domain-containing protein n=1 Tax=Macrostomum lignano TaxID=282301 RepID=A0A1I8H1B6_9PLAT